MFCTKCGASVPNDSKFCNQCGAVQQPDVPAPGAQAFAPAYVPAGPAQAGADASVSPLQRWLLAGVLVLGILFEEFFRGEQLDRFAAVYAAFWLCYLVLFLALAGRRVLSRPLGLLPAGAAVLLCVMMQFQAAGYSDEALLYLNFLAVPLLLMLHAQYTARPLPREREGRYALLMLNGFFVQPFQYTGRFFAGIGSLFAKGGAKRKGVWIGLLCAVPLLAVVLSLLLSADAVMRSYSDELLQRLRPEEIFWRSFAAAACAMLFYSFLYGASWGKPPAFEAREWKRWNATAPGVVLGALLLVYAVFTAFQFAYLFSGHVPGGMTYAEYAREGFGQLIWVAAINFGMAALCLSRVEEGALLRALLLALLIATGVILASAYVRLLLYIGAYGLTFKRIQAFWFLCYFTAVLFLSGARLYVKKLPLLRICTLLLILWYLALNVPDLTAWYPAGA